MSMTENIDSSRVLPPNASDLLKESRKEIARAMEKGLTASKIKRDEVAHRMSLILGRKITKNMIDAYASESRTIHTPAMDVAMAFDLAIGINTLSGHFVSKLGGKIIFGNDIRLLEVAHLEQEKDVLSKREKKARFVAGLDGDELEAKVETNVRFDFLESDVKAQGLILGYLMAKAGKDAVSFLRTQASTLEQGNGKGKYELEIAALDDFREGLAHFGKSS